MIILCINIGVIWFLEVVLENRKNKIVYLLRVPWHKEKK